MRGLNSGGIKGAGIIRSRKAFLFTLGLLLAALAILSFAKFVFDESEDEKLLFQTATITGRLNDFDESLQKSIADTFQAHSNIGAYFDNSTLVFEEPLPNSISGMESGLDRLKNFAESNETSVYLEVNETVSELPIFVLPQNITYRHNFSNREIILSCDGMASNIIKYRTRITVWENVTCDWSFTPGGFNYELDVVSPKDSGCDHDRLIDLAQNTTITVTSQSHAADRITIRLSNESFRISMDQASTFSADVKSGIYLKGRPGEAWLGSNLVEVSFDDFRLKRKGGARII